MPSRTSRRRADARRNRRPGGAYRKGYVDTAGFRGLRCGRHESEAGTARSLGRSAMAEDSLSDQLQASGTSRRSLLVGLGAALGLAGCARISANPSAESRVMDLAVTRRIRFDVPNYAHRLAWSHDGQRLALGGVLDARLSVWDVNTGGRLPAPGDQAGGTHALAYSPDGRYLAVARAPVAAQGGGQERYTVSLWDARTAALVRNLVESQLTEIPRIESRFVTFSPDGRYLAVVYGGGWLALYT